jgi:phosphohistidine phosphatase
VQVFLIRHAEAIDETLTLRDPHRHLTAKGREQARALGERLRWHDCSALEVWTSPLVRAVQTAELVLMSLGISTQVLTEPALAPSGEVRSLRPRLAALAASAAAKAGDPSVIPSVILVGHEPSLADVGSLLTGIADFAPLAKAEAVRIDGIGKAAGAPRVRWRFAWDDAAPRT